MWDVGRIGSIRLETCTTHARAWALASLLKVLYWACVCRKLASWIKTTVAPIAHCPSIAGTSSDEEHMSHENKKAVENLRALSVKSTVWVQTMVPPVISGVIFG